jgi:peptidoglycan/LPS O-acetylase OafA/YrhL
MLGLYIVALLLVTYLAFFPLTNKLEYVLIYTDLKTSRLIFFAAVFMTGVVFNHFQSVLKIQGWQALIALVGVIVLINNPEWKLDAFQIPLKGLIIFYLSYLPASEKVRYPLGHNDYSYGIYVYGMPIQQMLFALVGTTLGIAGFTILSLISVFPFAILSWHLVEKPMLSLKPKTA